MHCVCAYFQCLTNEIHPSPCFFYKHTHTIRICLARSRSNLKYIHIKFSLSIFYILEEEHTHKTPLHALITLFRCISLVVVVVVDPLVLSLSHTKHIKTHTHNTYADKIYMRERNTMKNDWEVLIEGIGKIYAFGPIIVCIGIRFRPAL